MYFVYFHTFSYKFKVQRTPTEFWLPVVFDTELQVCVQNFVWKRPPPTSIIKNGAPS